MAYSMADLTANTLCLYCVPVLLTHIHKVVASLWTHSDYFEREDLGWQRRHVSCPDNTKVKYASFECICQPMR